MPNEIGIPCPKCRLRNLELVILESSLPSRIVKIFKEKKYIRNCIQSGNEDKVSGVSGLGDTPRDYSMFLEGMSHALYWVQGKRLVNPIKIEFLYKDDPEMMEWKDPTEESD